MTLPTATTLPDSSLPHVLNYGMGVDSTAILLRWLYEPESRPFANWSQLIVLIAQTGNEFPSTGRLVERYVFPLLRAKAVRTVQVAKHGPLERDGYTILDDTRKPDELYLEGDYKLSEHLHQVGTVPLYSGPHTCAMKWKGFVLDCWLRDHLTEKFGPYLGYNADEPKRAAKCDEYRSRGNHYRFPLIEWEWGRQQCLDYIEEKLGVVWKKSCCTFCPFIAKEVAVQRWLEEPEEAAFALYTEAIALALNPRMHLFSHGKAYTLVEQSGNTRALEAFDALLTSSPWGLYRVERTWERKIGAESGKAFTRVNRRVTQVARGERAVMQTRLSLLAARHSAEVETDSGIARVYSHRQAIHRSPRGKVQISYPTCEGFWVVAPGTVKDKVRHPRNFQKLWSHLSGEVTQLELLSA